MNFFAYVERQKRMIRQRHEGETYLVEKGKEIKVSDSERLLAELDCLKGLNKRERRERAGARLSRTPAYAAVK